MWTFRQVQCNNKQIQTTLLNSRTFSAVDLLRVVQCKRQIAIGTKPLPLRPAHVVLIALVPASAVRLQELKMETEFCDDGFKAVRAVFPCWLAVADVTENHAASIFRIWMVQDQCSDPEDGGRLLSGGFGNCLPDTWHHLTEDLNLKYFSI